MTMLAKSLLSTTGRTAVPPEVCNRLGLRPGDVIVFEERNGEIVIRRWLMPQPHDPFASFPEWASAEDDKAYANLQEHRCSAG